MSGEELIKKGCDELGLPMDSRRARQFEIYYRYLEEQNKVMNLTAISGEEQIYTLHFLDSLAVSRFFEKGGRVADIGSGAGFPGVPLKICRDDLLVTVIDSLKKRTDFLSRLLETADIQGVTCIHGRAEEEAVRKEFRDGFDYATGRAVARLPVLCELCMPFVKKGGRFIAMKSVDSDDEVKDSEKAIKKLGGTLTAVCDYIVPCTDIRRRAVIIDKVSETPAGYPRRFAKIQKAPL